MLEFNKRKENSIHFIATFIHKNLLDIYCIYNYGLNVEIVYPKTMTCGKKLRVPENMFCQGDSGIWLNNGHHYK